MLAATVQFRHPIVPLTAIFYTNSVLWIGLFVKIERRIAVTVKTRIFITLLVLVVGLFGISTTAQAAEEADLISLSIFLMEIPEENRSTLTVYGLVDPEEVELPVTVSFGFLEMFEFKQLAEMGFETGQMLGDIEFDSTEVITADDGSEVIYTLTLTEGHGFFAGFEIDSLLYDRSTEMGDMPMAYFIYLPLTDLPVLTVGFISPSPELIGAGADVELLAQLEDGELYGITRFDVSPDEPQEFTVAFASRASRDAALAAAAEAERLADDPWYQIRTWIASPIGIATVGLSIAVLAGITMVVVLMLNQRKKSSDNYDYDYDYEDSDQSPT